MGAHICRGGGGGGANGWLIISAGPRKGIPLPYDRAASVLRGNHTAGDGLVWSCFGWKPVGTTSSPSWLGLYQTNSSLRNGSSHSL
eukprot:11850654-Alexandrium_andersonii.AAC.1